MSKRVEAARTANDAIHDIFFDETATQEERLESLDFLEQYIESCVEALWAEIEARG